MSSGVTYLINVQHILMIDILYIWYYRTSQYWFRWWLGGVGHLTITCANFDSDMCVHMAPLCHNELTVLFSLRSAYICFQNKRPGAFPLREITSHFMAWMTSNIYIKSGMILGCYMYKNDICYTFFSGLTKTAIVFKTSISNSIRQKYMILQTIHQ